MSKQYLKYEYRTGRIFIAFALFMQLAFMLIPIVSMRGYSPSGIVEGSVLIGYVISVALTFIIPALELNFVHMKRSVDSYLALPVSRLAMLNSILVYTFSVAGGGFLVSGTALCLLYGGQQYLAAVIGGVATIAALTAINSLVFLLANNTFDGIVMLGAYALLPAALYFAILVFEQRTVAGFNPISEKYYAFYLSPAYLGTTIFLSLTGEVEIEHFALRWLLLTAFGALSYWGLIREFVHRRSERAEQISDAPAAYPFIIPAYVFLALFMAATDARRSGLRESFVYLVIILFIYAVASFIYKRKIRVTWQMAAFFAVTVAIAAGLSYAAYETKGFGMAYSYDKAPAKERVSYYGYFHRNGNLYDEGYDLRVEMAVEGPDTELKARRRELIERLREQGIERFYSDEENELVGLYSNFTLGIIDGERSYVYYMQPPTAEELRELDRLGDLSVTGYSYDENGTYVQKELTTEEAIEIITGERQAASSGK